MVLLGLLVWFYARSRTVTQTVDNPALGIVNYHYQDGELQSITADSNRDGKIDFKARIDSGNEEFRDEFWEDRNFDGHFEIYVQHRGQEIFLLEVDQDHDGTAEIQLKDEEASEYWQEHFAPDIAN